MDESEQLTLQMRATRNGRRREVIRVADRFSPDNEVTLYYGDTKKLLDELPEKSVQLVVTSPPYNIGKTYERRERLSIEQYIDNQRTVIKQCVRLLKLTGSICWQVGNHVADNELYPIDIMLFPVFRDLGLVLRNRVVWHFEHGLHCSRRLSGRYETIMWFTWPGNDYTFNLDPIRVPQKYPGKKYFKGPKAGQYSANPLGKNPGDVWVIPNVKHNHVEKTSHPCQFPVELVERLVLALSNEGDLILDPYIGVGTTAVASVLNGRRAAGADTISSYIQTAKKRVIAAANGTLRTRPRHRPVYTPSGSITIPPWSRDDAEEAHVAPLFASPRKL